MHRRVLGAPACSCMIHDNEDSERHEVFGAKEFKKQP